MEKLEKSIEKFDSLINEGKNEQEITENIKRNIIQFEKSKNETVVYNPVKLGTILNPFLKHLKTNNDVVNFPTKEEANELIEHVDEKISSKNEQTVDEDNTKLITIPTNVLPAVHDNDKNEVLVQNNKKYDLTVNNNKSRSLILKNAGNVIVSILVTTVLLTIGVIAAVMMI